MPKFSFKPRTFNGSVYISDYFINARSEAPSDDTKNMKITLFTVISQWMKMKLKISNITG